MTKRVLSIDRRKRDVRCKRRDDEYCIHEKYAFNPSTMLRRVIDKVRTHVALVASIIYNYI